MLEACLPFNSVHIGKIQVSSRRGIKQRSVGKENDKHSEEVSLLFFLIQA